MAYTITTACISCQRCLNACPTSAIQSNAEALWIEVSRCNQCADSHGVPQCWAMCPTNEGCVPLATALAGRPAAPSAYWQRWSATYSQLVHRLQGAPQSAYWQRWFDAYAQSVQRLTQAES